MSISYLKKINSFYYFRIRIPSDVVTTLGQLEIQVSLRTKDFKTAAGHVKLFSAKAEKTFSMIRSGILSPEQIAAYFQSQFPSRRNATPRAKPRMLFEVVELFLQEHISMGRWTEKSAAEVTSSIGMFKTIVGNKPMHHIDRKAMVDYIEKLKRLPANMHKKRKYRDKPVAKILEMEVLDPMSTASVNKYLGRANALLLWSVRHGYLDRNPADGLVVAEKKIRDDEERSAYNANDLKRLVSSLATVDNGRPERYWIPLIGMYSGLRLNEICQLHLEDILEVEGVFCFDVNDAGNKRVKTLSSKRLVPIHPTLQGRGFLDYVRLMKEADHPRLWMNLELERDGYGHHFGKWYQRHNRQYVTTDPLKVFHSFRHTVANTLKQAGVAESVIAEILGHANHSITTGRYGKRYRPSVLLDALMKLDY
jgi:integrase